VGVRIHSQVSTSASEARAFTWVISDVANVSKRRELHFECKCSRWLSRSGRLRSSAAETEMRLGAVISEDEGSCWASTPLSFPAAALPWAWYAALRCRFRPLPVFTRKTQLQKVSFSASCIKRGLLTVEFTSPKEGETVPAGGESKLMSPIGDPYCG
jgi:hypothetical protein